MPTEHILELLIVERDRIQSAIDALGGTAKHGVGPRVQRKKRTFTDAQRKEQAARMKAYWAAKKKGTAKTKGAGKAKGKAAAKPAVAASSS